MGGATADSSGADAADDTADTFAEFGAAVADLPEDGCLEEQDEDFIVTPNSEQLAGPAYESVEEEEAEAEGEGEESEQNQAEMMAQLRHMLLMRGFQPRGDVPRPPVLTSFDLAGVADYVQQHGCKNIVLLCGAGISVSAGIPDFRSPGTGLYDNLQKYDLPSPQAIFEMNFFRERPDAFYQLAAELWPDNFQPTPTHLFRVPEVF